MEYQYYTLQNGLRIAHRKVSSKISHLGVVINAGTRDELPHEHGIAHFIEHMIFKGTHKRNLFRILSRLDCVGADLNAFTTKEETTIYASFLNTYYDRTLELFSDILLNSTFPQKEIEKEREVVIDEINSYKDSPSEQIVDDFEDQVFAGHALENNILGKPKNVRKFSREAIQRFITENYLPSKMVICSVGNISFERLIHIVEKYFSQMVATPEIRVREPFTQYQPVTKILQKSIYQSHLVLGTATYGYVHPRRTSLGLLTNLLGGPAMNTRLNLAVREKHGITYTIESQYTPYTDTGFFYIYMATDDVNLEKATSLVHIELKKLREYKLTTSQLHQVKRQLIGQLVLSFDSNLNDMLSMGKSLLLFDKVDTPVEVYRKVEEVTAEELLEVANDVFNVDQLSCLIYMTKSHNGTVKDKG
jgi:predicted Zn-dependent peptidase